MLRVHMNSFSNNIANSCQKKSAKSRWKSKAAFEIAKIWGNSSPPNWCIFKYESPLCSAIRNFKVKAKVGVLLHYKPEFP